MTGDATTETEVSAGSAHWAPLLAVSLAMFIVVLDSTMIRRSSESSILEGSL